MATANKRSKSPSKSKSSTSAAGKRRKKADPVESFTNEVILLIVLAVSIVVFISNFGVGGFVGEAVSDFCFGLFGIPAYIFPLLMFVGVAFFMSNKTNPLAYKKMIAAIFCYIFLCALSQLLTEGYMDSVSLFEYYEYSARYHNSGGGILGGVICSIGTVAFGEIGTYILVLAGLIISLIFVTQRSFFGFLKKIFAAVGRVFENYREKREETRPEREAKALERSENRKREKLQRKTAREAKKAALQEDFIQEDTSVQENSFTGKSEFLSGTKLVSASDHQLNISDKTEDEPEEPFQMKFEIHRSDSETAEELSDEPREYGRDVDEVVPSVSVMEQQEAVETAAPVSSPASRKTRSSKEEIESGVENIKKEIGSQIPKKPAKYHFPPLSLLTKGSKGKLGDSDSQLRETARKLETTLRSFGVNVTVTNVSCGPTVTRYELQPEQGVKVSKILSLADDIKLNLATADIRIEAPIPGKAAVGIEVPNKENSPVRLRELLQTKDFRDAESKLSFAVGKDIAGNPVITDIAKMPHLLIAGATGSGKSVCINTLIMSILYKASPEEVKLIMIDPKVVELSVYNGIPHLLIPVVTDPKKAAGALNWAVAEMTDRYNTFAEYNVRNLADYNSKLDQMTIGEDGEIPKKMSQIVVIVDELADLMMVASKEVEDAICRLAQLARAAGIHLVIATQRPSVNVITGLIKANMPSRIAFAVSSGVDSRTILDMNGAENLLGKGDMLFAPQGYPKPARLQGALVSDSEVSAVVNFLSDKNPKRDYDTAVEEKINAVNMGQTASAMNDDERDIYFKDAGKFIIEKDKASIGMLQRSFKIGFNRAARIMDQLSEAGVVGPEEGTKPRKVLMSMEEFEKYIEETL